MAELFDDPNNWRDYAGYSPPAAWDGTKYHFLVGDTLTYQGAAVVGDTVTIAGTVVDSVSTSVSITSEYPPDNFAESLGSNDGATGELSLVGTLTHDATDGTQEGKRGTWVDVGGGGRDGYTCDITFAEPVPPDVPKCAELGRVTRAYVSGYQRDRVHASRLVRGEKRCLVANFNGAIPAARSIASVTWRCEQTYTVVMANARISGREAEVDITAQLQGCAWVKCVATLDNGEAYTQMFRIGVCAAPWFDGEGSATTGPSVLTSP